MTHNELAARIERAEGPECSAYIRGDQICRNGFPQRLSCWNGQGWATLRSAPHCMNEDYSPPHIISDDTGLPLLTKERRDAGNARIAALRARSAS